MLSNLLTEAYGQPTAAAYGQPPSYEGYGAPAAQETTGYVEHLFSYVTGSLPLLKPGGFCIFFIVQAKGNHVSNGKVSRGFLWY